jgi:ribosomal-protein-alanine N-acetyltransferase
VSTAETRVPLLRTERLLLRPPEERDIPAWFARATDREAAALAGDPVPDRVDAGAAWLARSRRDAAEGRRLQWSIDHPGVADGIGTVSLSLAPPALAFVLAREHWGRGLATEAAGAVLRHAVAALGLREIGAEAVCRNAASIAVLTKLGFRRSGEFIDETDGERCARFVLVSGAGSDAGP